MERCGCKKDKDELWRDETTNLRDLLDFKRGLNGKRGEREGKADDQI